MSRALVICAHPDDEILGVGATIAKRVNNGDEAYTLILAEGQTSRENASKSAVEELHHNTIAASKIIGYKSVFFENLPDNRMDSLDLLDIVKIVERYINELKPDDIYTHHIGDLNIDHQLTHKAVLTATRPIKGCLVKNIYAFQTVSSTEWNFGTKDLFEPNVFVDINNTFEKKCKAMKEYKTELCDFPHPRSLEMLEVTAKYWGSFVGIKKAEAFELLRSIHV